MAEFFVDTNVLVHCRDLGSVSWKEITEESLITVLVPVGVLSELDSLKRRGNSRAAKRARKVTGILQEMMEEDASEVELRASDPRVVLRIAPHSKSEYEEMPDLDYSMADNRIIREVHHYNHTDNGHSAPLLSNDVNAVFTAKRSEVEAHFVPKTWLLPPEPDSRDDKIRQLENTIKKYEADEPSLVLKWEDSAGTAQETLSLVVDRYRPLEEKNVMWLVDEMVKRFPRREFGKSGGRSGGVESTFQYLARLESQVIQPSEREIRKYQEADYPKWVERVEAFFTEIHLQLEGPSRVCDLTLSLHNDGSSPLHNLIIQVEALGGLQLDTSTDSEVTPPEPPPAPKPPELRMVDLFRPPGHSLYEQFAPSPIHQLVNAAASARDPHEVYWKDGKRSRQEVCKRASGGGLLSVVGVVVVDDADAVSVAGSEGHLG